MKITKERLIEIIKEELEEAYDYRGRFDGKKGDMAWEPPW